MDQALSRLPELAKALLAALARLKTNKVTGGSEMSHLSLAILRLAEAIDLTGLTASPAFM
jgi:hypothetical protein